MSCLHNQRLAGKFAAVNGIAPLASRNAYLSSATQFQPPLLTPTVRQVAARVLRYNLQRRYEWMILTGRDPRMGKGDVVAMLTGTAIATAIILVRLKLRERRQRGRLDR
jgi:hypothetical protein